MTEAELQAAEEAELTQRVAEIAFWEDFYR